VKECRVAAIIGDKVMPKGELILYTTEDGGTSVRLRAEEGTVWLSQAQIAALFDKGVPAINEHIQNIIKEGELEQDSTIRKSRIVRNEDRKTVERKKIHYNLLYRISQAVAEKLAGECYEGFNVTKREVKRFEEDRVTIEVLQQGSKGIGKINEIEAISEADNE
jgi:hypothetical protein